MNILDKINRYPWADKSLRVLKEELDLIVDQPPDIPAEPGGWWHQFVCPDHHTELLFDPLRDGGNEFLCPRGCRLTGEPYRGAWLVFKHNAVVRYALQAAVVWAGTGDARYAEWSKQVLLQYAEMYPAFPAHRGAQSWMLGGRVFHQALTEAIWAVTYIRAFLLLQDTGVDFSESESTLNPFFSSLESNFRQSRKVLFEEKKTPESNYMAWFNAALAGVYASRGEAEKMAALVAEPGGFRDHLSMAINSDQLEFEGSIYYHVFVLRAYFIAAEMAERLEIPLFAAEGRDGQSLKGMLDVLACLASDNGELPSVHDGPYRRLPYAREIAEVCEIGYSRYRNSEMVPILKCAYREMNGADERTGLESLLFGEADVVSAGADLANGEATHADAVGGRAAPVAALLAQSGYAVARQSGGGLQFCVDFGKHGGSHGHYDKLHISLANAGQWIAPDPGMVPYGSSMRAAWYAATASHNTVVVSNQSQAPHAGECVKFVTGEGWAYCWVKSAGAYDGCVLNRHLLLTSDWLLDWFEASAQTESTFDWWMHAPEISSPAQMKRVSQEPLDLGAEGPYSHVKVLKQLEGEGDAPFHAIMSGKWAGAEVSLSSLNRSSSQWYLADVPGTADQPDIPLQALLHRQTGRHADFITVYKSGHAFVRLQSYEQSGGRRLNIGDSKEACVCILDKKEGLTISSKGSFE